MDRRKFIQISTAGTAFGSVTTSSGKDKPATPTSLSTGHPAVMAPRTDGVEILWRVNGLAKGYIEFGTTQKLGNTARNDGWGLLPAGNEVIRVRLDGLKPGTTYHYRTVTESFDPKNPKRETSTFRTFRTLSSEATTSSFTVWNDTHKHNDTISKLNALTPASDFLLWNGDISNDWYRDGEVASTLLTPGRGVDFTAKHPLVFVRGNHDLRGTLAYQVKDFSATPGGKPWCAFRSGPIAVICMDTGEDKPDNNRHLLGRVACEPMRHEQAEWLKQAIEQPEIKNAPYRLMFCHIPLRWTDEATDYGYDWFSKRSRDLWHNSLIKWGTQLVISGHTHNDAYLKPNKHFPYAQLVGGGPKMRQARLIHGKANAQQLLITMLDMNGKKTRQHTITPLT